MVRCGETSSKPGLGGWLVVIYNWLYNLFFGNFMNTLLTLSERLTGRYFSISAILPFLWRIIISDSIHSSGLIPVVSTSLYILVRGVTKASSVNCFRVLFSISSGPGISPTLKFCIVCCIAFSPRSSAVFLLSCCGMVLLATFLVTTQEYRPDLSRTSGLAVNSSFARDKLYSLDSLSVGAGSKHELALQLTHRASTAKLVELSSPLLSSSDSVQLLPPGIRPIRIFDPERKFLRFRSG